MFPKLQFRTADDTTEFGRKKVVAVLFRCPHLEELLPIRRNWWLRFAQQKRTGRFKALSTLFLRFPFQSQKLVSPSRTEGKDEDLDISKFIFLFSTLCSMSSPLSVTRFCSHVLRSFLARPVVSVEFHGAPHCCVQGTHCFWHFPTVEWTEPGRLRLDICSVEDA